VSPHHHSPPIGLLRWFAMTLVVAGITGVVLQHAWHDDEQKMEARQ
jgi:hypothetical protein